MSTMVDDAGVGSAPDDSVGGLSDDEVLARCREIEARRRADLAEHIRLLRQLEQRKLYCRDGHRDLAGFGRAEYRRADRDAKAHRDLERLCRQCPQILDELTIGRVGAAQVFLLGRLARSPRVGMYVAEKIDDFLDHAATLSFLAFEQYVIAWKCLIDQDGPDPDRAHRNRTASMAQTGLLGRFAVEGPAIDHARLKTLMARFEQIEFHRDWIGAKQQWGDDVTTDKLARTASQRRYDAFQELLRHVTLPKMPKMVDPDLQDIDNEAADATPEPAGPVDTVLNIVIDGDSAVHGLEQLLGINLTAPVRSPFGPDRAFCHTFDGDPTAISLASRLFTAAVRDAVLMTATHCTHPGCTVPATKCQIDHLHPAHRGGITDVRNGADACGHHNRWRHAAKVRVVRLDDGTLATYRPNHTRIAPPD